MPAWHAVRVATPKSQIVYIKPREGLGYSIDFIFPARAGFSPLTVYLPSVPPSISPSIVVSQNVGKMFFPPGKCNALLPQSQPRTLESEMKLKNAFVRMQFHFLLLLLESLALIHCKCNFLAILFISASSRAAAQHRSRTHRI